jgi:glycosyltransferase involved in cell wall biosynthesis/uncharacterized membrane protein YbhN (UPF0104 family)
MLGVLALGWAVAYLADVASGQEIRRVVGALLRDPLGLASALAAYAAAFGLRTRAWRRVLPTLSAGHAWAALHVSLAGNHVLPLRMGEALRPLSVARRTDIALGPAAASTVTLRAVDLIAVLGLALLVSPALVLSAAGGGPGLAVIGVALIGLLVGGAVWTRRQAGAVTLPDPAVVVLAVLAWSLEAAVVWEVARVAGIGLSPWEAVGVTAVTIAAQVVAVTPGGFGTYEAAATAAMVGIGTDPAAAFAVALTTHAVKTCYALAVGAVALFAPAPTFWGHLRLARSRPPRPPALEVDPDAPIVVIIPVYDEEDAVGQVVSRVPRAVAGRRVEVLVVDDGSTDGSAAAAAAAGATVIAAPRNLGLGAAVRRGLAEASARRPAAVVYLDADGEYFPEDIPRVVAPVLDGSVDYVVGSRFRGDIRRMLAHRRFGNRVLTRWVRWMARRRDLTDGQSGFRAFSPAAAADGEIAHDYNYAQVLTLDLLAKGYSYGEIPITYAFRESGTSFVRLGRYLGRVVPAVHRELNSPPLAQSSTTWSENRRRAAAHRTSSLEPSSRRASTAS